MQGKMQDSGQRINYDGGAMREPSTNKGAYELVSPFALERIAVWYELGARKYTKETTVSNWEAANELCRALQAETSADYAAARFIARGYAEGAMREIFGTQMQNTPNASERTQGNGTGNTLTKSKIARESGQQTQSCANGTDRQSEPVCCEAADLPRKRLRVWLRGREIPAQFAEGTLMGSGLCILTMTTKMGLQEDTYVAAATTASECLTNLQKCFVGQYPTSQILRRLTFAHRDNEQIDLIVSGNRNWEKGIPFGRLIQSAIRHMIRWMKGDRSEDHLAAVCWNVMAMIHFEETGQAQEWNNYPAYQKVKQNARTERQANAAAIVEGIRRGLEQPINPAIQRAARKMVEKPDPYHRDYKIIAVDFDGCLCKSAWPEIGAPNTDVIAKLIERRKAGDKLILWTCREGEALQNALMWCKVFGLEFDAVNANLPEMNEMYGNDSRKIGADWYLDDKSVCVRADGGENKWDSLLT